MDLGRERTLHSLAGLSIPPQLEADLGQLFTFPHDAVQAFWEVLGPFLAEPPPPGIEKQLAAFARRHSLEPPAMGAALRACRLLFREAARWQVTRAHMAEDLALLCGPHQAVASALLAGFEPAMKQLHHEITFRSVADHGRVLMDVTWRLDNIVSSTRGEHIDEAVASLTLTYLEGPQVQRITLQALPREMVKLQAVCARILGGKEGPA